MNLDFLNDLIKKCEKTLSSLNPDKCSSGDFLVLVNGTKNFRDFCLRNNLSAYFIFEEIFSPNGYERPLGTYRPKDIESEVKLILNVLKKVKRSLKKEDLSHKKERIFKIEQNNTRGNITQFFGGVNQDNITFENPKEKTNLWDKIKNWVSTIVDLIKIWLKILL